MASSFQSGDIDGDGKVDHSDLKLLKSLLQNAGYGDDILDTLPPEEKARLDVNGDGQITYEDVVALCEKLVQEDSQTARALADKFNALRQRSRS